MGRGRTPDMPELAGMMTAEDVAEVVLFVLTRPAEPPHPRDRVPAGRRRRHGDRARSPLGVPLDGEHQRQGARRRTRVRPASRSSPSRAETQRRAEDYARERGIERAHGSYEALLEDPDVEAVYISLPNSMHVEWSIRALEAGKHVLCEKPLSRRAADVERAFDAAERAGRLLMEAFMYRHNPQTVRLKELVDGGAIGRLRLVRAAFSFPLATPENVRLSAELDGGGLMDVGCYCVSGARLLAGEPVEVYGQQVESASGVDELFTGHAPIPGRRPRGARLRPRARRSATSSRRSARKGSIFVDDPWHCHEPVLELRTADGVERIELEPVDSYRLELENLSDAIRGRAEPLLGREDALGQARTIEALYRSAEEGRARHAVYSFLIATSDGFGLPGVPVPAVLLPCGHQDVYVAGSPTTPPWFGVSSPGCWTFRKSVPALRLNVGPVSSACDRRVGEPESRVRVRAASGT